MVVRFFLLLLLAYGFSLITCLAQGTWVQKDIPLLDSGAQKVNSADVPPVTPFVTINSSSASICSGKTTTLTAMGGDNYSWSNGETTNSIVVSPSATTTYSVTSMNVSGNGTASATITVLPLPNALITASANTICAGQPVTLTASGGNNYMWNTNETNELIEVSPTSSTLYFVMANDDCGSDTSAIKITVVPPVVASITISEKIICLGQTTTLLAFGVGNYFWNTGSTTSDIIATPSATSIYSVTVSNGFCSSTASGTVTVNRPPVISVSNTTICSGDVATISASGDGGYVWSTGATTASIFVSPLVATTYSVVLSNLCGGDIAFPKAIVNPRATAQFSYTVIPTDTCSNPIVQVTNHSINSNLSQWDFGDGYTSFFQNVSHSYIASGIYNVTLVSNNLYGCFASTQQKVDVSLINNLPLFIPNAFSPNGDNENDYFLLQGTECIKSFSLDVYNRWGEKIFSTNYQSKGWDGTRNGVKENSGLYVYYLKAILFSGEVIRRKGNVTLIR
jgi:gliding motility-associated-like protein